MNDLLWLAIALVWFAGWVKTLFDVSDSIELVKRLGSKEDADNARVLEGKGGQVALIMLFLWIPYQYQSWKDDK